MNKAIRLAIKGGWIPKGLNTEGKFKSWIIQAATNRSKFHERYLLDPLFWQALGKVEGWGDFLNETDGVSSWKYQWHSLIDHLSEGKDADSFFGELLANDK